jgi:trimeric autotransporter adhesin
MNRPNPFSSATLHHVASLISRSPLRRGFPVVLLVLGMTTLLSTARAIDPPPDGGYPGDNTAEGEDALFNGGGGGANTAVGYRALYNGGGQGENTATGAFSLSSNTNGFGNTGIGYAALFGNTTGGQNTATGNQTLVHNTTGSNNTANGFGALYNNTGSNNTANGAEALEQNASGSKNTATGSNALSHNASGSFNTADGNSALFHNTTGTYNTASGGSALGHNITGNKNTAIGFNALQNNTGSFNTANGAGALYSNTIGNENTADGLNALLNNTSGDGNIALGVSAGIKLTTGDNNIDIGNVGVAAEADHIRIGTVGTQNATYVAGISGVAVTGTPVAVSSNGQLGVAPSSARFKEAIKPMDKASEAILSLQPVAFRYEHDLDPDGIPQFGLVAEQVEKVNPDLVVRGEDGRVMTVRYEAVNAMLLNEFLKEHKKVQKLESTVTKQESDFKATLAEQQRQIESLTATVQKVSDQIALSKPSPQLVANP